MKRGRLSVDNTVDKTGAVDDFTPVLHVYEPHKAGIPPLLPYVRELWRRREFANESSKASLRSENTLTVFGQLWMVLNPLLLAGVYKYGERWIEGTFFRRARAMGNDIGYDSIVGGGKLLLNTSFPRLLMPFAAVRTSFFRFLPTIPVYLIFHILAGNPWNVGTLCAFAFFAMLILFGLGIAAFFATIQVYFRDATSFLPYFNRIWLYISPVMWLLDQIPEGLRGFVTVNPLFSLIGGYTGALVEGKVPALSVWITAAVWSVASLVLGSLFFISREREFAVRIA